MATGTKTVQTQYVLNLSEDEARTLAVVLSLVGGDTALSPRRHADSIADTLHTLGITSYHPARGNVVRPNSGIVFYNGVIPK